MAATNRAQDREARRARAQRIRVLGGMAVPLTTSGRGRSADPNCQLCELPIRLEAGDPANPADLGRWVHVGTGAAACVIEGGDDA